MLLSTVQDHLERHEAENGLLLGFLAGPPHDARSTPLLLARLHRADETLGIAYMTSRNLILSRGIKQGSEFLVQALLERRLDPPGLVGPRDDVEALTAAWTQARGCGRGTLIEQMLYELHSVVRPTGVPGRMRPMAEADVERVASWIGGFYREALPHEPFSEQAARENAAARLPLGQTYLWEVAGTPVAMAALARPTRHGVTVNAVYTPPIHRQHGYASALVADLSEEGLRRGKTFCALYTDLANPTANAIYQRIGYRPVSRAQNVRLDYPS